MLVEEIAPDFRVVIVDDDQTGLSRAKGLLNRLICQLDGKFKLDCILWHSDMLASPQWHKTSINAGDAADLIIVSTSCENDLSMALRNWLYWSLVSQAPGSVTLMGLVPIHPRSIEIRRRTREFLERAADRGRQNFLLYEVNAPWMDESQTASAEPSGSGRIGASIDAAKLSKYSLAPGNGRLTFDPFGLLTRNISQPSKSKSNAGLEFHLELF